MSCSVPAALAFAACMALSSCAQRAPTNDELKAYGEAKVAYAAGKLADAEKTLAPLAKGRALPQAQFLLGKTRFFLGRYEEAAPVFKNIGARFPKYHEADIWLARTYLQLGRIDEAHKIALDMLAGDSGDSRLYYLEAMTRVAAGDLGDAIAYLERSSEAGEELAKSYFEAARLYYRFGQDEKAAERLKRAAAMLSSGSPMLGAVDELLKRLGTEGRK